MNAADTTWMLISTALVLLMTPALAFFYGGLVRSKNALNTMMMSFISLGFVGIVWALVGYSLAFSTGNAWIGDLSNVLLNGVALDPAPRATNIPHALYMAYQGTFAIITAALISGAIVERMRFSAYTAFITLWVLFVYAPIAHWVWGGGWLAQWGALDFAGGTVVHVNAAVAALAAAVAVGKRQEYPSSSLVPHSVPLVLLGAGLLWFGWFGFNAGSAVAANGVAASAFIVTNTAAAAATITWVFASYLHKGKVSVVGAACGAVAGLVAITPASGYVGVGGALVIGLTVGGLCYSATLLRSRLKIDDALDVFAVHGVGGMFGAVATGIFATAAIQEAYTGLLEGNVQQLATQLIAVAATVAYAVVSTFLIVKVVDLILGIRVSARDEEIGIDLATHGEVAYQT